MLSRCSESITPPRGCMLHRFHRGGSQRQQIYNKNNSTFSHVPVLKYGEADCFFHKGFVIACDCFKPLFLLELLALFSFFFIVFFYGLQAISKPALQDISEKTSLRFWLFTENLEVVDLDVTMNRRGPADLGPVVLSSQKGSLDVYMQFHLITVLLFGLILSLTRSVHPQAGF